MISTHSASVVLILLFLSFGIKASSQETFVPPKREPKSRYLTIWENSPFELEATPEKIIAQPATVPPNDYFLAGVIKRGETYIAYIQNRKTGAVVKATDVANPSGFVLKEVIKGNTPGEFEAKVERHGQPLTLSYDRATVAASVSSTSRANPKTTRSTQADFNPAKLALEKARQKAAEAKAEREAKGATKSAPNSSARKRTIFVPK